MATKQAHKRLTKEYKMMTENPPPFILARPNENNILEWHYIITGPPDTPYFEGQYHGTLTFPSDYPYKPPAIRMVTPNGRFRENTRLCLSMSDYHPDTWNPGWSVSTILNGLLSFMTGVEQTTGSIVTSDNQKKIYARKSVDYNTHQSLRFKSVFPDIIEKNLKILAERKESNDGTNPDEEESKRNVNTIENAAKEKPVSIEDILDPEDKIRAQQALKEANRNNDPNQDQHTTKSTIYIVVAILLVFLGVSMK